MPKHRVLSTLILSSDLNAYKMFVSLLVFLNTVPDAEYIMKEIKSREAILTHLGMTVWRAKPWEVAEYLSQKTGTRVIAARDGMKFDLA